LRAQFYLGESWERIESMMMEASGNFSFLGGPFFNPVHTKTGSTKSKAIKGQGYQKNWP
jgi:hypothetical protein